MKRIALAVALLLSWGAFADEWMARNGADEVRLSDAKCTVAEVLEKIDKRYHEMLMNASATFHGQPFKACWISDGGAAHLLYEDGDQGLIPLPDFKPIHII